MRGGIPPGRVRVTGVMTPAEQDSPLAAKISTLADGYLPSDLEKAVLTLDLIDKARSHPARPASWAVIGRALGGISGPEAKKYVHGLREQVKRAQALAGDGEG